MSTGAAPKIIEEFDIPLEDGSATTVVPPEPPPAPSLVLLVPREYTWRVGVDGYKSGTAIAFFLKGGRS